MVWTAKDLSISLMGKRYVETQNNTERNEAHQYKVILAFWSGFIVACCVALVTVAIVYFSRGATLYK